MIFSSNTQTDKVWVFFLQVYTNGKTKRIRGTERAIRSQSFGRKVVGRELIYQLRNFISSKEE